jgi:hypothetical protein
MESLFKKHSKAKSNKRGLECAKVVLNFVSNLGDGPISVPGLKAAAQLCIQIVEVAQVRESQERSGSVISKLTCILQKVEINQDECTNVADRAQQLVEAMILSMEGKSEADLDPRLKSDTERFGQFVTLYWCRFYSDENYTSDLEKILKILKRVSSSNFMNRVRSHISHANEIQLCKDMLDQSFKAFQVRPSIVFLYGTIKITAIRFTT